MRLFRGVSVFLVAAALSGCHPPRKTATVSLLVQPSDYGDPVPCVLDLVPTSPTANWRWKPPTTLHSKGLMIWWPEMGLLETWPTEFKASLSCRGYHPWSGRVVSKSAFKPEISIEARLQKL
jgi:hypothetical protein